MIRREYVRCHLSDSAAANAENTPTSQSTWSSTTSCGAIVPNSDAIGVFDASHISFTDEMGIVFNEHWINRIAIADIPKALPALDNPPQALERFRTPPTTKPGCPNASDSRQSRARFFVAFAHKRLQFIQVSNFWNFIRRGRIREFMPSIANPVHHGGVMNVRDSFNAAQSHAIQVHLDAQLSHIVRVAPRSVGFEN